ncbi:MAG: tRNA 2-thiouridine(34) synthase MnmA [candidate division KSB1 bacterium]|nr:tRNA 2-thiouridine(34) synthase MnmA [candidate division KSB1 bacterium]
MGQRSMFRENRDRPLIAVAMSGGVDSSVAAALLVERGYRVVGLTLKLWDYDRMGGNVRHESTCCSVDDIWDARAVAEQLGIPHYVVDARAEFEARVVRSFEEEYLHGRTPNPCVLCNSEVKWRVLLRKALSLGAQYFATGHYARILYDADRRRYLLLRARDPSKDQSYALWALRQEQLQYTLLPLGELSKGQVRELAGRLGLRTANKADSQEICFVPDNDYRRYLRERFGSRAMAEGEIVDLAGNVIGRHQGYVNFTIGQRRGLGVSLGKPAYVVDIRPEENRVVVGGREALLSRGLVADRLNWISIPALEEPMRVWVKTRYRDRGSWATIFPGDDGGVQVEFEEPQAAVTPGQSVVFYEGDAVVGGGVIARRLPT